MTQQVQLLEYLVSGLSLIGALALVTVLFLPSAKRVARVVGASITAQGQLCRTSVTFLPDQIVSYARLEGFGRTILSLSEAFLLGVIRSF